MKKNFLLLMADAEWLPGVDVMQSFNKKGNLATSVASCIVYNDEKL